MARQGESAQQPSWSRARPPGASWVTFASLALGALVACSSAEPTPSGHGPTASSSGAGGTAGHTSSAATGGTATQGSSGSGGNGSGGDVYVAGLEKQGQSGVYVVKLVESQPIPQDTGLYTWTIQLLDAGDPVSDAVIAAEPRMPAHNHGTFPPITDATPAGDDGMYTLDAMDLFMPGIWEVTIRIMQGDSVEDQVTFSFDLEG